MTTARDLINYAIGQLDYHENPIGSNSTIYGQWYGIDPAAWCAMFVSYCFSHVGMQLDMSDVAGNSTKGFSSVGNGKQWFVKHNLMTTDPQPGDIVFFEWENDQWPDHTGVIESINADGTLNTIEGNSPDPVPDFHGDEVARHTRGRNVAKWFGRPIYKGDIMSITNAVDADFNGSAGAWVAQSDGGVITHGDAQFYGSMGSTVLAAPIVSILANNADGYYLLGADGGVFAFGSAKFKGSYTTLPPQQGQRKFLKMIHFNSGYMLLGDDGSHYAFS